MCVIKVYIQYKNNKPKPLHHLDAYYAYGYPPHMTDSYIQLRTNLMQFTTGRIRHAADHMTLTLLCIQ